MPGEVSRNQHHGSFDDHFFNGLLRVAERSISLENSEQPLFVQPVNKKEDCKLPTTKEQMERRNFRSYWDGDCRNGYAFGLGRDIAISDTHHVEEITIHNGTGDNWDSPGVMYDFVNTKVEYRSPSGKFPASSWMTEDIQIRDGNYFVNLISGVTNQHGHRYMAVTSPLSPIRHLLNEQGGVVYRLSDRSRIPTSDLGSASLVLETLDPKTQMPGGGVIVRHASGQVRHIKLNGTSQESVMLPEKYVTELTEKIREAEGAIASGRAGVERARQMEREYLYLACNGKYLVDGLDQQTSTKICDWRAQFKEQYERALAKYTNEMEALKSKADAAAQQRQVQRQVVAQQNMLQQQQNQLEIDRLANSLSQFGQQMQNSSQQMLNSTRGYQVPRPSFGLPESNQIRCINTGYVTNCRY